MQQAAVAVAPHEFATLCTTASSCPDWCSAKFATKHCTALLAACRCCTFCVFGGNLKRVEEHARLHASANNGSGRPREPIQIPSARGGWDCAGAGASPEWFDRGTSERTSSSLPARDVLEALRGRWLVLIGDSTMRMVYHMLLGSLTLGWRAWPTELQSGHGPDFPHTTSCLDVHAAADQTPTVTTRPRTCIEDAPLLHLGTRLTCVWSAYGALDDLAPFHALLNTTLGLPSAVVVGIGAWWAWHRPADGAAYTSTLTRHLAALDELLDARPTHRPEYFGGLWRVGTKMRILASTPNCGNATDAGALLVERFNVRARATLAARPAWTYLDREIVTRHVCAPRRDCAGDRYTSRFHPSGAALNVIVRMVLHRVGRVA